MKSALSSECDMEHYFMTIKAPIAELLSLMQTNLVLCCHAETIISHAFKIPCCFSEVPS